MHNTFNPQEMTLLTKVVDDACRKLHCDEAQIATVAARVLSFARETTTRCSRSPNLSARPTKRRIRAHQLGGAGDRVPIRRQ